MSQQDALLAGLATRAGELSDAAKDLRRASRLSRFMKIAIIIGLAAIVLQIGLSVLLLISNLTLNRVAHSNEATGAAIRDCTVPTGKCAQRGARQTGAAVAAITGTVDAEVTHDLTVALVCFRHHRSDAAFTACVTGALVPRPPGR